MATGKVNRGLDADLISERREVSRISFSAGQACTVAYNNSQRVLGSLVKKFNSRRTQCRWLASKSEKMWPVARKTAINRHRPFPIT